MKPSFSTMLSVVVFVLDFLYGSVLRIFSQRLPHARIWQLTVTFLLHGSHFLALLWLLQPHIRWLETHHPITSRVWRFSLASAQSLRVTVNLRSTHLFLLPLGMDQLQPSTLLTHLDPCCSRTEVPILATHC